MQSYSLVTLSYVFIYNAKFCYIRVTFTHLFHATHVTTNDTEESYRCHVYITCWLKETSSAFCRCPYFIYLLYHVLRIETINIVTRITTLDMW